MAMTILGGGTAGSKAGAESFGYGTLDPVSQFGQTEYAKKYGPTQLALLRNAQRVKNPDGSSSWQVLQGQGRFDLKDLGAHYAELGQDYANWMDRRQQNDQQYASYLALMAQSPGREGTQLAPRAGSAANTILGTTNTTVLG